MLPPPLAALGELVANLRWSWHSPTRDLFATVAPTIWDRVGDPGRLLGEVSADRLAGLAADEDFLARLAAAHDDLRRYLTEPRWYQGLGDGVPELVAYFSPEFGITEVLPQYSGGLGILAGDHLKAASDLGVPIVGVGLLYRAGYFNQSLTSDGWQQESYPALDTHGLPLTLLRDAAGAPVRITVGLPDRRTLAAQIWQAWVGRATLLLLDSDIEGNGPAERGVTDRLYGGGVEHRLLQEILLGVGGVRAVRAWCAQAGAPEPEVYHTNEGHAGFLGLERIRELMSTALAPSPTVDSLPTTVGAVRESAVDSGADAGFDAAREAVRAGTIFTTHTPVPAGIDRFPRDLVAHFLAAACPGLPIERVLELGGEADPHVFNMAHMGLRLAQRCNGVSVLHGQVSREMFASLWPGFDVSEVPITSITNGVHGQTWVAREAMEAAAQAGADAVATPDEDKFAVIDKIDDEQIWALRRQLRGRLVAEARRRLRTSYRGRGATDAELGWIGEALDRDVLTIGFARRVPSYKRLTLMLRHPDRLRRLLSDPRRPVQIVVAGKAHPADDGGKKLIQKLVWFADDAAIRHRVVFLPDYDMGMARFLVAGCDVWLNNPLRPLEACGTSGMKAALNGGLNLSIRDGWWDEMFDEHAGWEIPTASGVDPDRRDDLEATALYELIETQVAPLFYDRDARDVPTRWVGMVRHTLRSLGPRVVASRMVRDYVEQLYVPAARASQAARADGYRGAREVARWRERVTSAWDAVAVTHVESSGVGDAPELGATLHLRAEVMLGPLASDDVAVQACSGRVAGSSETLTDVRRQPMRCVGAGGDGTWHFEADVPLARAGTFGYTVRVVPHHASLASPVELGLVRYPPP